MNVQERAHVSGNAAGPSSPGNAAGCAGTLFILGFVIIGIFTLVGLVFAGGGIWIYLDTSQFVKTAHSAPGTVIEMVRSTSEKGASWCPVVEFNDHHGELNTFQLNACSNPPSYRRGESVTVLYAPEAPNQAKLDDKSLYLLASIFTGLGAGFVVLGCIAAAVLLFVRRRLFPRAHNAAVS